MKTDKDFIYIPQSTLTKQQANKLAASWSVKHQAWRFPRSILALQEVAKENQQLAQTDAYKALYSDLEQRRAHLHHLKHKTPQNTATDRLRPYQRQDVNYLTALPAAGIFNQPRTGKTPTAIELIKQINAQQATPPKTLLIVPASLQYNWLKELKTWYETAVTTIYKNSKTDIEKPDVTIISKDKLKLKANFEHLTSQAWHTVIVDEAHFLRNRDTAQSEAVYKIGRQAVRRYALTGTPTVKHAVDIFGILRFLYPDKFSSYWGFVDRYFHIIENGFGKEIGNPKQHRLDELHDLLDAISTQRQRKDIMQWLPDKQRITHLCEMEAPQRKIYKEMAEDFFTKYGEVEIDTINTLAQLTRLRQITLEPHLLNLQIKSAKTTALLDIIENNLYTELGEPIIIMSHFSSYLRHLDPLIKKLNKRTALITGQETNKQKQETAEAFQLGKVDVLLCNIISAGTGFTLDRGEIIIFLDKAWNPADNEQAEDRITPTTQDRSHAHTIVSLVCKDTIDEKINDLLERKENITSLVNQLKKIDALKTFLYN